MHKTIVIVLCDCNQVNNELGNAIDNGYDPFVVLTNVIEYEYDY